MNPLKLRNSKVSFILIEKMNILATHTDLLKWQHANKQKDDLNFTIAFDTLKNDIVGIADAFLNRVVNLSHRIDLQWESQIKGSTSSNI